MSKRRRKNGPRGRTKKSAEVHPALRLIGIADHEIAPHAGYNVAREHDRALADAEIASWRTP